jgi:hypothetical protein
MLVVNYCHTAAALSLKRNNPQAHESKSSSKMLAVKLLPHCSGAVAQAQQPASIRDAVSHQAALPLPRRVPRPTHRARHHQSRPQLWRPHPHLLQRPPRLYAPGFRGAGRKKGNKKKEKKRKKRKKNTCMVSSQALPRAGPAPPLPQKKGEKEKKEETLE